MQVLETLKNFYPDAEYMRATKHFKNKLTDNDKLIVNFQKNNY